MNVLLVNPRSPYLENDAAYPPMGLMYVAACFEREGVEVKILDLTVSNENLTEISRGFDLVGLTCVTPNVPQVMELANKIPWNIPIIVGGAHPTHMPDETMSTIRCDSVIIGEAETVIPGLVRDLKIQDDMRKGYYCSSGLRKRYYGTNTSVELIPKPARHLVNLHKYTPGGDKTTPVHSSRGCSFNCAFCSKMKFCSYRKFPVDRVIEEVHECMDLGFKHIVFGDDNFILDVEHAKTILREIAGVGINFRLNQDARVIRNDIFKLSADAGCTDISFGIESGSQEMLDRMNKRTTVEKNEMAIRLTKEYGMQAKAYFMVNFPGETEKTVSETIDFARRVRPDKWLLSAFVPLPGSDTFLHPEKYGITSITMNWHNFYLVGKGGGFTPSFTTSELTAERQIELHDKLYNGLKEVLG